MCVRDDMCLCERVSCVVPFVRLDVVPFCFLGCYRELPEAQLLTRQSHPTENLQFCDQREFLERNVNIAPMYFMKKRFKIQQTV